ncbi:hypothetical protein C8F01DRAFT_1084144 [Mycena amicta]|nr:hypothetical protein C8F01DRAFT_1084144 [Mycena amicta]
MGLASLNGFKVGSGEEAEKKNVAHEVQQPDVSCFEQDPPLPGETFKSRNAERGSAGLSEHQWRRFIIRWRLLEVSGAGNENTCDSGGLKNVGLRRGAWMHGQSSVCLDNQYKAMSTPTLDEIFAYFEAAQAARKTPRRLGIIPQPHSKIQTSFPAELLALIFRFDTPEYDGDPRPIIYLSHVARSWRHATLADPDFWGTVTIRMSDVQHISVIRAFLERSREMPVRMVLDFEWDNLKVARLARAPTRLGVSFVDLMDVVREHLPRAEYFKLRATAPIFDLVASLLERQQFESLAALELEVTDAEYPPIQFPIPHGHATLKDIWLLGATLEDVQLESGLVKMPPRLPQCRPTTAPRDMSAAPCNASAAPPILSAAPNFRSAAGLVRPQTVP